MMIRLTLATFLMLLVAVPAAHAERQTYNPYTTGVTYYELQREQARQQRRAVLGADANQPRRSRGRRTISREEQETILTIDQKMKERFPIHPGLYRDAYDRGTWRRHSGPGNNPGDN